MLHFKTKGRRTVSSVWLMSFLALLSPGGLFAQRQCDSVRIYFVQGKADFDMALSYKYNELEALQRIRTLCMDSTLLFHQVIVTGWVSPEGEEHQNRKLSADRATALYNLILPDMKGILLEKKTVFGGTDWRRLLDLVRADQLVPYQKETLALLEQMAEGSLGVEADRCVQLKRLRGGKPYAYLYEHYFPCLRSAVVHLEYEKIRCLRPDTVYIPVFDTVYVRDTVWVSRAEARAGKTSRRVGEKVVPSRVGLATGLSASSRSACWAVRTNLLFDAVLIPNLGVEYALSDQWTVAADWCCAWLKNDRKHFCWCISGGELAVHRWLGKSSQRFRRSGHHIGIYGHCFTYDLEWHSHGVISDKWCGGIGLAYGYAYPLNRRLHLDFSVGCGFFGGKYQEYLPIDDHYVWQKTRSLKWYGPTRLTVTLVGWLGKSNNKGR